MIRILHVTDSHLQAGADGELKGVNVDHSLRSVVAVARTHPQWPPRAILATGDLVHDEKAQAYQRFRAIFEGLGIPVLCIPGNHDDPETMRRILGTPPFQYCGELLVENWVIVLLDTFLVGATGGRLSPAALESLDRVLYDNADRHALVCLHHHPVPVGSRWLDELALENDAEFFHTLDRHANVRAVLWGHVHQVFERDRNGVRLMSTPSTCAQFLPNSDEFELDTRPPACRWLGLHPDGQIDSEVVWIDSYLDEIRSNISRAGNE